MIHNFENTESWDDKAGNTSNSKLASPQLLHFCAPFLCIHHQLHTKFTPLKVSHLPPLKKCSVVIILNLFHVFVESIKLSKTAKKI